jgi:hypothetical protein
MTDEQRQQRIHHHMYETCEGIAEHAERIVKLEELVQDMWPIARSGVCIDRCAHYGECIEQYDERGCMLKRRMEELGIPRGQ